MDIAVNKKDIFKMELYYRINKTMPQLKRTIYRIKNIGKPAYESYFCVVYSLNYDADHEKYRNSTTWTFKKEHGDIKTLHPHRIGRLKISRHALTQ